MVEDLLPAVEEGDTLVLDRRSKFDSGRVEWNRQEVTVKTVREDGITVEYEDGWADLQMLFDYGDARLAQETQRTIEQFAADTGSGGDSS